MAVSDRTASPIACRAYPDYTLWLRYSDGLEGNVFLGTLVDIGEFTRWRDVGTFLLAKADAATRSIVWPGVRLEGEVLRQDLTGRGAKPMQPSADPLFCHFMAKVIKPIAVRRGRRSDASWRKS